MQIYGKRYLLDFLGIQGLTYLVAVISYYLVLLEHPAGLWDEHSSRNSGIIEGLGLVGVWVYSVICRSISRRQAWETVALDQVRAPAPRTTHGNNTEYLSETCLSAVSLTLLPALCDALNIHCRPFLILSTSLFECFEQFLQMSNLHNFRPALICLFLFIR